MSDTTPSPASSAPPAPRRRRHRSLIRLALLLALPAWLLGSNSGLATLAALATTLSGQRLQLEGISGSLLGPFGVQGLRWQGDGLRLEADGLRLDWRPARLAAGEVHISRLELAALRIASAPSAPGRTPPAKAAPAWPLPFTVQVAHLHSGPIQHAPLSPADNTGSGGATTAPPTLLLDTLDAEALHADAATLQVARLRARRDSLQLQAQARLTHGAKAQLQAGAVLTGSLHGQTVDVRLQAEGPPGRLPVHGSAAIGPARATLQAELTPFAPLPLAGARLDLQQLDLATLQPGAPRATLGAQLSLQAEGDAALRGTLRIDNAAPGPLDQGALPLVHLASALHWRPASLRLTQLELALPGKARLVGDGELRGGQLQLGLQVHALDPARLHGQLLPEALDGPLQLSLAPATQRLEAELRGRELQLHARLQRNGPALVIEQLQLAARRARLEARGSARLEAPAHLQLEARLQDFDPARFLRDAPAGQLQARIEARAEAGETPAVQARIALDGSRLAGQPLSGSGQLRLRGATLEQADVDLAAGPNRLRSRGGFGQPGQTLALDMDAPRLNFGPLRGDLAGRLQLAGSLAAPRVEGSLRSHHLLLPGGLELAALALAAHLPAQAHAPLQLDGELGRLAQHGKPWLQQLRVHLRGSRAAHRLELHTTLAAPAGPLQLALAGTLTEAAGRPRWQGRLEQLQLQPQVQALALQLAAPAELQLGADGGQLGPATLQGRDWQFQLDQLARQAGRWRSSGRLQDFPLAALPLPQLQGDLRLDGDWQLAWDGAPAGHLRLSRRRGDLRVGPGEAAQPLGLESLQLQAEAGAAQLRLQGEARGRQLGRLTARLGLPLAGGLPPQDAPLQGELSLDLPEPGWIAPLLRPDSRLAGHLRGTLSLAGSLARPRLDGRVDGEQLAFTDLASGLQLKDGQLAARFADGRLLLDSLRFNSATSAAPTALQARLPAAQLGRDGRLEAHGELDPQLGQGQLQLRLERVGVLQQPERWVLLSGDTRLSLAGGALQVGGQLVVDAAWWKLSAPDRPRLSDDVVIIRPGQARAAPGPGLPIRVDLQARLGPHVLFSGAGLDSRLAGELRLQGEGPGPLRASGSIRSEDGRFNAYGQQLEVRRGIVNFQGLLDNPGLNILAVRPGLAVEAGVQVAGSARQPRISLVSSPELPDAEKLSWLILGHGSEQASGGEQALLVKAAVSILGGEEGGGIARRFRQAFNLDELSLAQGSQSSLPTSQVAGSGGYTGGSTGGQIITLGKRLSERLYLSFEQSLSTTGSVVKLTLQLTRQLSLVGQAGSDNAVDAFYTLRFGQ